MAYSTKIFALISLLLKLLPPGSLVVHSVRLSPTRP